MNQHNTHQSISVIKVGGNDIDSDHFLAGLVEAVVAVQARGPVVIVHGGGKEIADLHARLGVGFEVVEGLRVTSAESLLLVKMVLSGVVNTRLTRWLVNGGVNALGLSGVDLGLIRVEPLRPQGQDIGFVGQVVQVRTEPLLTLLAAGITPVVSPVSLGIDGHSYNVNADQVASALAAALGARQVVFVSNVPGVLLNGMAAAPEPHLSVAQIDEFIANGVIFGGMVPKVRSATESVRSGVPQAVITDLQGLRSGSGTVVTG